MHIAQMIGSLSVNYIKNYILLHVIFLLYELLTERNDYLVFLGSVNISLLLFLLNEVHFDVGKIFVCRRYSKAGSSPKDHFAIALT